MKKQSILTLVFAVIFSSAMAQDFETPKQGAKLYVENTVTDVVKNGETTFDLWLVKSKVARKADFETPKVISPEGLKFTVTEDAQNPGHYTVSVKADETLKGTLSATVMAKRSGIHSVTGTILTLNVGSEKAVASNDGE